MKTTHASMLLVAVLGFSGAAFAAPANETSDSPLRAGEASVMTNGVPNVRTSNSPYGDRVALGGRIASQSVTASETSDSPLRAGEMSTMTRGAPNVVTNNRVHEVSTASMTIEGSTALGAGPAK
jgi:hypothetical protein